MLKLHRCNRLYKAELSLYLKFQNPPRTLNEWGIWGQPSSQSLIACMAISAVMISDLLLRIIKSDKGNYLHLIGIHTCLTPDDFFDKCYTNTLTEDDFDFTKLNQSEKSVKGSVREKISVLPLMVNLFEQKLMAENNFKKNRVECAFATCDGQCTLGFVSAGRPKSLLKGNELNADSSRDVELIFRKPRSSSNSYYELVYGEKEKIIKYHKYIKDLIPSVLYQE